MIKSLKLCFRSKKISNRMNVVANDHQYNPTLIRFNIEPPAAAQPHMAWYNSTTTATNNMDTTNHTLQTAVSNPVYGKCASSRVTYLELCDNVPSHTIPAYVASAKTLKKGVDPDDDDTVIVENSVYNG